MPEEWGPPAKNWLKQRAGLLLNDTALQWVWAEAVRQRPDPKPKMVGGRPISGLIGSSHTRTTRSGFSSQALRLADEPLDSNDPRVVEKNKKLGVAFRDKRQQLLNSLGEVARNAWGENAPEYLHWLRLEFLLDMTPDKRRGLPVSQWLISWAEPQRIETLTEYTRLETLLHRYDDQSTRDEETKVWKHREGALFRDLWNSDLRELWNHRTLRGTLALLGLRTHGRLRYWNPSDFAGVLQRQPASPLSKAEQALLDEWMEGIAMGKYDRNDPDALAIFLSTSR